MQDNSLENNRKEIEPNVKYQKIYWEQEFQSVTCKTMAFEIFDFFNIVVQDRISYKCK